MYYAILHKLAQFTLIALALLAPMRRAAAQDRITLRPTASVASNVVRVGDIADVVGPASLGEAVVVKDLKAELGGSKAGLVVDVTRVRAALERDASINWGRLTLSGVPCRVRALVGESSEDEQSSVHAQPGGASDGPTMKAHIESWLAVTLNCAPEDLRLSFDQAQDEFLDSSASGQTVSIRSLGASDKLSLAITTYRGDVITNSLTVRVTPLIRRDTAVATRRIGRGEVISPDVITRNEQWLPPGVTPIEVESLRGVVARSRIEAGTVIRAEHIDQPILIKKGEIATVDCVSGGVVVRAMARAMSAGKEGEVIPFQYLESKRSFNARVNAPGRAVVVVQQDLAPNQATEQAAVEMVQPVAEQATRGKVARHDGGHP